MAVDIYFMNIDPKYESLWTMMKERQFQLRKSQTSIRSADLGDVLDLLFI